MELLAQTIIKYCWFWLEAIWSHRDFVVIFVSVLFTFVGLRACRIFVPRPGIEPMLPAVELSGECLLLGSLSRHNKNLE